MTREFTVNAITPGISASDRTMMSTLTLYLPRIARLQEFVGSWLVVRANIDEDGLATI